MIAFLLAQAPTGVELGWLAVLIQGGSFALVCVIVLYLFPRWQSEHRIERDTIQRNFIDEIRYLNQSFNERTSQIVSALNKQTEDITKHWDAHAVRVEKTIESICKGGK